MCKQEVRSPLLPLGYLSIQVTQLCFWVSNNKISLHNSIRLPQQRLQGCVELKLLPALAISSATDILFWALQTGTLLLALYKLDKNMLGWASRNQQANFFTPDGELCLTSTSCHERLLWQFMLYVYFVPVAAKFQPKSLFPWSGIFVFYQEDKRNGESLSYRAQIPAGIL